MQQILPNIYRIDVPLPGSPLKVVHDYLILGGTHNLLIDTAFNMDQCAEALLAGMEALGAKPEDTDIFLTHMHVDHSGLVARLKRPSNTVYIGAADLPLLDLFQSPAHWDWLERNNLWTGVPAGEALRAEDHVAYSAKPSARVETRTVTAGETIEAGGYALRVLDLAGHTPGQVGLWHEESGTLFSGDHILGDISPNISAWDLAHDYLRLYLENLRQVRALPVKRLLPAHREAPADLNARIDEMLEHHQQRLACIRELFRDNTALLSAYQAAKELVWAGAQGFGQLGPQQRWFACSEALAHLQHLHFAGELELRQEGETYYYSRAGLQYESCPPKGVE